jgi:hypothetical protein
MSVMFRWSDQPPADGWRVSELLAVTLVLGLAPFAALGDVFHLLHGAPMSDNRSLYRLCFVVLGSTGVPVLAGLLLLAVHREPALAETSTE